MALEAGQRGLETLREAHGIGNEAIETGTATSAQLKNQGKQLRDAEDTIKGVNDDAMKADQILKDIRLKIKKERLCLIMFIFILLSLDVFLCIFFFGCG